MTLKSPRPTGGHVSRSPAFRLAGHSNAIRASAIACALFASLTVTSSCRNLGPQTTRIAARPQRPTMAIAPGVHDLAIGTAYYRGELRDGMLFVPRRPASERGSPLLILMHGGAGDADQFRHTFPLADAAGVAVLALDARHNTWDAVDSPFGPDVLFIDAALRHTFARVAIDPTRIALGGMSDGGMYALSVGMMNGDLFTHIVAVAPGYVDMPGPPVGRPRIFLAHGARDNVYAVSGSRDRLAPQLRNAGYDVTYFEFDGPHFMTAVAARAALEWLVN
jgi:phospholipase/carboxylesterase